MRMRTNIVARYFTRQNKKACQMVLVCQANGGSILCRSCSCDLIVLIGGPCNIHTVSQIGPDDWLSDKKGTPHDKMCQD